MLWEARREDGLQIRQLKSRLTKMQSKGWNIKVVDNGSSFVICTFNDFVFAEFPYTSPFSGYDGKKHKINARWEAIRFLMNLKLAAPGRPDATVNGYEVTDVIVDEIESIEETVMESAADLIAKDVRVKQMSNPLETLEKSFVPIGHHVNGYPRHSNEWFYQYALQKAMSSIERVNIQMKRFADVWEGKTGRRWRR